MQVDPIRPTLKPPGTKRLHLRHEKLLSSFAFNVNLRRYNLGTLLRCELMNDEGIRQGLTLVHLSTQRKCFMCDRGCSEGLFRGCVRDIRG